MTHGVKYFFSGASGIKPDILVRIASTIHYRLLSMHDTFKSNTRIWTAVSHEKSCALKEVMLDSGAFTAFTKGKKPKLEDLISVYDDTISKLNKRIHVWLINLDVIPGAPDRVAEPHEIEAALDESDRNFKVLRKRYGDRILPVYHQTEPGERLYEIAKMSDYICMGFRLDFAEAHRVRHAEESLSIATRLGKRTHGLATTGYRMLRRTNFHSVDSSSWMYAAAMGKVLILNERDEITVVPISRESPLQKDVRGHFNNLPGDEQEYVLKRIAKANLTLEALQCDLSSRILMVAKELTEWLEEHLETELQSDGSLFGL